MQWLGNPCSSLEPSATIGRSLTVLYTTRAISTFPNPPGRSWYTLCTVPRQEDMVDISALFTWFNATTGGLVLPPLFADLWLAALLARPTRLTLTPLFQGFVLSPPLPSARSNKSCVT